MDIIKAQPQHKVSPDLIYIKEWKYALSFSAKDAITILYNRTHLYTTVRKHPMLPIKDGFQARIWTDSKIITWWYDPDWHPYITIWEMINTAISNHYIQDLISYTAVFRTNRNTVIRVPIREMTCSMFNTMYDNTSERALHLMPPLTRKAIEDRNASIKEWRHKYYIEDCKVWTKRIGNMDVAEWHLLIF